jgi:hypothetical protein
LPGLLDLDPGTRFYGATERPQRAIELLKEMRTMAWREGEVYRCPDPECGCEVTVTRGSALAEARSQPPTCCCGKTMQQAA